MHGLLSMNFCCSLIGLGVQGYCGLGKGMQSILRRTLTFKLAPKKLPKYLTSQMVAMELSQDLLHMRGSGVYL